jgi:ribosomal protein S18 acetylase RimI-like enzyme
VEAELLEPDDWREYREIRLAGLGEAPHAFGSTLAGESGLTEADWRRRLAGRAQFVVRQDGKAVGMVGGIIDDGMAELVSMWVDPGQRGRGIADVLVRAVQRWARRAGYASITLWVTVGNMPAVRLYERHGFRSTGKTQPVRPDDPGLLEQEMIQTFVTVRPGRLADVDAAARLWAEATAARDGDDEVAALSQARPVLVKALSQPGAEFTVAADGDRVVAFATASQAAADGDGTAEVSYLGSAPDRWGEGLAAITLRALASQLAAVGYQNAQLLVYEDNPAAMRLYERLGWVTDPAPPAPHPHTGKPQQRYLLAVLPGPAAAS